MQEAIISKAKQLLADGTVNRVIGWKKGEFAYDITPAIFESAEEIDAEFVYDDFTSANVSKYLVKESKKEGKILAFLKPCDTYSLNQLTKEHRVNRENIYVVGIPSDGKLDAEKIKAKGITGITGVEKDGDNLKISTIYGDETMPVSEAMSNKCLSCKSKKHVTYDELIGEDGDVTGV
ncbi:MAG: 4Fe-4S ferredoxin, partial [Ruminococcus sp.]|nr:4Fe-4S ferredoxin [Ruminococcus sp.]